MHRSLKPRGGHGRRNRGGRRGVGKGQTLPTLEAEALTRRLAGERAAVERAKKQPQPVSRSFLYF